MSGKKSTKRKRISGRRPQPAPDIFELLRRGTQALQQIGGAPWRDWSKALHDAVVPKQRTDGCRAGSWDPIGCWGADGGRVYATAILVLALQAPYR